MYLFWWETFKNDYCKYYKIYNPRHRFPLILNLHTPNQNMYFCKSKKFCSLHDLFNQFHFLNTIYDKPFLGIVIIKTKINHLLFIATYILLEKRQFFLSSIQQSLDKFVLNAIKNDYSTVFKSGLYEGHLT